ncbi:MAG: DUF2062 domain-containing protein [Planctomycetota bacterium]|jgi:uncharacterized protein (DUF2062 family)|nr:DUF2062 domain-containing protein [Planctomycetota bacterium]
MLARKLRFRFKFLLRELGRATGTAHQIALGVAIGFFVGWLPIIGIQMVVAIIICQIVHANKIVPIFPIWLTNPATAVPIYSFNYWVGWKLLGGPPLSQLAHVIMKMFSVPAADPEVGYFANWWICVRQVFRELISMGWEMQLPLWLGCAIVGTALAVPSYFLVFRAVDSFRHAVSRKRSLRELLSSGRIRADAADDGMAKARDGGD